MRSRLSKSRSPLPNPRSIRNGDAHGWSSRAAGHPEHGQEDHNLQSRDSADAIPISNVSYQRADNEPAELRDYEAKNILDTDVNVGNTSHVTFTPTRAGTFQFHSGEGDDEKLGMVGTFIVLAPGVLPSTGDDPRQPWVPGAVAGLGAVLALAGLLVRRRVSAHGG